MSGVVKSALVNFPIWAVMITLAPGLCAAQDASFMSPGGPIAAAERAHFISVASITMIAVLPVLILVPLLLWRYRYGNRTARYTPKWEFSAVLDALMWGVPGAIVILLSVQLWRETVALDPYRPLASDQRPLVVQVVGLDWKWLFLYPEQGVASVGEMAFPAGRPVSLTLTSDTVMQSFLIAALAGQIYVMPGMTTRLQLLADAPGAFSGENTQFNGDGFPEQQFTAQAMDAAGFDAWVARVRRDGVPLDDTAYRHLAVRSTQTEALAALATTQMPDDAIWFSTVAPGLFDRILNRYHAGLPLVPADQPGSPAFAPTPGATEVSR